MGNRPQPTSPDSSGMNASSIAPQVEKTCGSVLAACIRTNSGTFHYDKAPNPSLQKNQKTELYFILQREFWINYFLKD